MRSTVLMVAAAIAISGCRPTAIVVIPSESDEVVMRMRVTDDIPPDEGSADPTCTGAGPDGLQVTQIASGYRHSCLLLSDGTVRCWGANDMSQIGNGSYGAASTPTHVPGLPPSVEVAVSAGSSCAVTQDGRVMCWGSNSWHELGSHTNGSLSEQPQEIPGLRNIVHVAMGMSHGCALDRRGQVSCWGRNTAGQNGNGDRDRHELPVPVARMRATAIAAGLDSTCAVTNEGTVTCWGALAGSARAVVVQGLPMPAVSVAVGQASACARLVDGTVYCWGDGTHGQLGSRERGFTESAVLVDGLPPAQALAINENRVCIADGAGQVFCWGSDQPFNPDASGPRPIGYLAPVAGVAIVGDAGCSNLQEGGLCCWGSNSHGILGAMHHPFSVPAHITPIPVPMLW